MLADIYKADPNYTYQVGGFTGDEWTYQYSNKINDIFPVDTTEIDLSICIAGNNDCDHFKYINMEYFPYRMLVKDSESSDPNYRKMVVDEKFTGYKTGKLLGSCLVATNNSSFVIWSITQKRMVVGGGDLSDARFCLGNKLYGFKNLILAPSNLSVEKTPPVKSATRYSADSFENVTTLEDIENRLLKTFSYDIKHFVRDDTQITNYTFSSQYKPQLVFIVQGEDDEILLVNAAGVFHNSNGGLISNFQNGVPITYTFGQMIDDPEWEQMCTDVTKPQWVCRPPLGNVTENLNSMYCEVYTSRSYWYLYSTKLFIGALVRRIFTFSGLFFTWDKSSIEIGADTDIFNSNLCLGQRDEYGLIKQDEYNKGWDEIKTNDKYYDKLDYDNIPIVNPNPPQDDDDYPDDPWGKIEWGGAYLGAGNFTNLWYCTATDLDNLRRWMNGLDIDHPLPEGFNPMNQVLGLMQFPIGLGGTLTQELTMRTQANVTVHSGVMINRGFGDDLYYNLGSIDIPLRMKERGVPFLDYGSTIELYVPFCGVFQLDPQTVLGADLSVEMWLSPVTGECNCIVSVGRGNNRGPVAFGSGNMAADIPVTANGYGLYAAAAKEASLKRNELILGSAAQSAQSLSTAVQGANSITMAEHIAGETIRGTWGTVGGMLGGASTAIGVGVALAQATHNIRALDVGMQHVKNASGTSVSGSFSGTSAWHYPFQCYVKITRPRYRIPSNYAHTQGIPLVKAKTLSSCNGFTMCVGTDLSSVSATEIEKEQIAAFLSNGVIV